MSFHTHQLIDIQTSIETRKIRLHRTFPAHAVWSSSLYDQDLVQKTCTTKTSFMTYLLSVHVMSHAFIHGWDSSCCNTPVHFSLHQFHISLSERVKPDCKPGFTPWQFGTGCHALSVPFLVCFCTSQQEALTEKPCCALLFKPLSCSAIMYEHITL